MNPKLKKVVLCLDNDEARQTAAHRIRQQLYDLGYRNVKILTPQSKDWDEDLKFYRREKHT